MYSVIACRNQRTLNLEERKRQESSQPLELPAPQVVSEVEAISMAVRSPSEIDGSGSHGSSKINNSIVEISSGTLHDCASELPSPTYPECAAEVASRITNHTKAEVGLTDMKIGQRDLVLGYTETLRWLQCVKIDVMADGAVTRTKSRDF